MADVKNTQAIFSAMLESRAARKANKAARKVESKEVIKEATGASMFTGRLLRESIEGEDVTQDILDNIVVVTDPDKSVKDLETRADDIQDAIEGSAEGEAAFSDEYVGDKVYACPICGESFFAEDDYNEGDACPICKAEPDDGFLLQGIVSALEPEAEEGEENVDNPAEPEEGEEPVEDEEEDVEISEEAEDEENSEDKTAEESYDREDPEDSSAKEGLGTAIVGGLAAGAAAGYVSNKMRKEAKDETLVKKGCVKECDEPAVEVEIEVNIPKAIEAEPAVVPNVELDENSFDCCLNQFAEENYGDCVDCMNVEEVTYSPEEDVLKVECKAVTKDGKEVPVTLEMTEEEYNNGKATLVAKESTNVFKIESKRPAFEFKVRRVGKAIKCESMNYSYITRHSTAGRVKVEGVCRNRGSKKVVR